MSDPISATRFQALVDDAGIPATFYDGWQTRNRGQRNDGWGRTTRNPTGVHGVLYHHTVTRDFTTTLRLVRDVGQPENEVPPPLYHGFVDKQGHLHVVGWGRVNHAGLGDLGVLNAVIREDTVPAPVANTIDGNARFYGFAGINMGDMRDPWPAVQLETLAAVGAVICAEHGWTERSAIGHHQWQVGKVDPRGPEGYLSARLRQLLRGKLA